EQVCADLDRIHTDRLNAGIGNVDVRPPPGRGVFESRVRRPIVHEVDGRQVLSRKSLLDVLLPQHHELMRVAIRQRAKQDGIDDAEDGGGSPGSDAEGQNRDRGERWGTTKLTRGKA